MGRGLKLSEDLRPLSELKRRAGDVVNQVQRTGRPVVLTRHGKGVAVILSLQAYEELEASRHQAELQAAVAVAEREYQAGEYVTQEHVDAQLAAWESGE
jgi:prevent-host-death family protein